jgi:hypothetical protein
MFQGNFSDVFYSYYQTCLLFFMLSQYCCIYSLDNPSRYFTWMLGAGVFSALAFFTKQSSGAFAIIGTVIGIAMSSRSTMQFIRWMAPYALGGSLVTAPIIGYLAMNGCMDDYLFQVFFGASSKGSLGSVIFGFLDRTLVKVNIITMSVLVLALLFVPSIRQSPVRAHRHIGSIGAGSLFFLMIILALLIERRHANDLIAIYVKLHSAETKIILVNLVFFMIFGSIAAFFVNRILPTDKRMIDDHYSFICLIGSFLWMWSHGMSYVIEEHSCLPGLSFLVAVFCDRVLAGLKPIFVPLLMTAGTSALLFIVSIQKLFYTYSWWGWVDFAYSAESREKVGIPDTIGFRISHGNAGALRTVYLDIVSNSVPTDAVFTFPHCPIFNYISNRKQPSFAPVTYFDVCPDSFAIQTAFELRCHEPKVMVVFDIPDKDWKFHEDAFRAGSPSGQRALWKSVSDLTSSGHYHLLDKYADGGYGWILQVWVRNENSSKK